MSGGVAFSAGPIVGPSMSTVVSRQAVAAPAAATVISLHELKTHCASCSVRELCLPVGLGPDAMRQLDKIISHRTRIRKRESLYRPGDPFRAVYAVRLGTFKTVLLAEDGREQITGYHMAGEVVGLDGISNNRHACQAVALEDGEVCVLPFDRLDELADDLPLLRSNLYRVIARDGCRDQDMMLLLGSRSAEELKCGFLQTTVAMFCDDKYFSHNHTTFASSCKSRTSSFACVAGSPATFFPACFGGGNWKFL